MYKNPSVNDIIPKFNKKDNPNNHRQKQFTTGGQRGLVVKRPPGNQEVGGSNPTTAM